MWEVRVTPCGEFDNHPFESAHFETRPLTSAMGAEVVGIRLPDLSDEGFEDFKRALYHHKMLFLKDQHLTHAEHEEFGARLGPFAVDAYTQGVEPDHQGGGHESREPVRRRLAHRQPVPARTAGDHHPAAGRGPALRRRHQLDQLRPRPPPPQQDLPGHAPPPARVDERGEQLCDAGEADGQGDRLRQRGGI